MRKVFVASLLAFAANVAQADLIYDIVSSRSDTFGSMTVNKRLGEFYAFGSADQTVSFDVSVAGLRLSNQNGRAVPARVTGGVVEAAPDGSFPGGWTPMTSSPFGAGLAMTVEAATASNGRENAIVMGEYDAARLRTGCGGLPQGCADFVGGKYIDDFSWSLRDLEVRVSPFRYDGVIKGRSFGGFDSTFGYGFDGPNMSAEFLVRDNKTLDDLFGATGFTSINWIQLVTDFPIAVGCLTGTRTPFLDPPLGGCRVPQIEADNLPFYLDVGDEWSGTKYFVDDYILDGVARVGGSPGSQIVDVGISFFDTPGSFLASENSPMSFELFPVGVRADGTWETLVNKSLSWTSTNNKLLGGGVGLTRNSPIEGDFEGLDLLSASFTSFSDLAPKEVELLRQSGGTINVPTPATLTLFGLGLASLGYSRRKKA